MILYIVFHLSAYSSPILTMCSVLLQQPTVVPIICWKLDYIFIVLAYIVSIFQTIQSQNIDTPLPVQHALLLSLQVFYSGSASWRSVAICYSYIAIPMSINYNFSLSKVLVCISFFVIVPSLAFV